MTFNVYYTHRADLDSSFVDSAWYDETRHRLVLDLNDVVYEYYDVQKATYDDLVNASSPGTFYRKNIQGARHSKRLGSVWDLTEVEVEEPVRLQNGGVIRNNGTAEFSFGVQAREQVAASGVSKPEPVKKFSLAAAVTEDKGVLYDHTIHFTLNDEATERSHTVKAESMDNAIEQVLSLADVLDADLVVKGVTVRFD